MNRKENIIFQYEKKIDIILFAIIAPVAALASTLFALALQPVIDSGLSGDITVFIKASVWAVFWGIADVFFVFVQDIQSEKIKIRYTKQLRLHYFKYFFEQRIEKFIEKDSSFYLSKLTVDAEVIAEKYVESLLKVYKCIWSLIISIVAIILARWELAIYAAIFSLLSVNLPKLFQKKADLAEQEYLLSNNRHIAKAQESVNNFLVVRLFGIIKSQEKKYSEMIDEVERKDNTRKHKTFAIDAIAGGISELSFVLIIIFAMVLVINKKLSVGYIMSVSQLLGGIMFPFEILPGCLLAYRTGKKIYNDNENMLDDVEGAHMMVKKHIKECEHHIQVKELSFSYTGEIPLLDDINLSLDFRKKYALVGTSGSGKSTLAKIIMGFLKPTEGMVSIDDIALEEIDETSLYNIVSYQSQMLSFFNDTIKNNILLGNDVSEDIWNKILQDACLDKMLDKLSDKENFIIGENGKNVSGGEAQRICLARSLAKNPQFIIFDEIASSLDNHNASEIEKTILSLKDVGILMITHRIFKENMEKYDKILVMKDGRITEQGTWDELIMKNGDFAKLLH